MRRKLARTNAALELSGFRSVCRRRWSKSAIFQKKCSRITDIWSEMLWSISEFLRILAMLRRKVTISGVFFPRACYLQCLLESIAAQMSKVVLIASNLMRTQPRTEPCTAMPSAFVALYQSNTSARSSLEAAAMPRAYTCLAVSVAVFADDNYTRTSSADA